MNYENVVSIRGFSIHPEEGKINRCAGCYWEVISGKCLNKVHHEIDNELPQCGRLPIIYKHESGRVFHGC